MNLRCCKLALFALAVSSLAHGLYIPAKAELSQWLIAHSWNDRQADSQPEPPWRWADTRALARLEVPSLGIRQFIMDIDSGQALAFGPGHMPGSALPAHSGHSMIAGHRDTHFAFLQKLKPGDTIEIEHYRGHKDRYRVEQALVIDSSTEQIPMFASDMLTLVTCYPFDSISAGGPLRYIVHAVMMGDSDH